MCDVFAFFYIILYFWSRYLSVDFYCYYFEVYNYAVLRLLCGYNIYNTNKISATTLTEPGLLACNIYIYIYIYIMYIMRSNCWYTEV